eukprot:926418_1
MLTTLWKNSSVVIVSAVLLSHLGKLLDDYVDIPYMDEIFHVRQTQAFCSNRFDVWDDKITTLPGLYLSYVLVLQLLSPFVRLPCTLFFLRAFNSCYFIGTCYLLRAALKTRVKNAGSKWISLVTLELSLFPLHFFFVLLFYTDPGSTFWVLAMYLATLRQCTWISAVCGAIAVFFRQSNIVWVVFASGSLVIMEFNGKRNRNPTGFALVADFVRYVFRNLPSILVRVFPYILVVVSFGAFVWINGGIVVGDKSNHTVMFHFPQLLYFTLFTVGFMGTRCVTVQRVKEFLRYIRFSIQSPRRLVVVICLAAALAKLVQTFTHPHIFILSDNRHFTFYLWRWFLGRHDWARYSLIPLYLASFWFIGRSLDKDSTVLWQLLFWICTSVVLIPAPLIEFRYFIAPYLILQLHTSEQLIPHEKATSERDKCWIRLRILSNIVMYSLINFATISLFLWRPYEWSDGSTARFMW